MCRKNIANEKKQGDFSPIHASEAYFTPFTTELYKQTCIKCFQFQQLAEKTLFRYKSTVQMFMCFDAKSVLLS